MGFLHQDKYLPEDRVCVDLAGSYKTVYQERQKVKNGDRVTIIWKVGTENGRQVLQDVDQDGLTLNGFSRNEELNKS